MVLLVILCGPIRIVLCKKYPYKGLFGLCMPCCFPDNSNKTSHPRISHNSNSTDPQDLPHMEDKYEAIKDSSGTKRDGEDLNTVIQNAKRSTANRAALAHKLDSECVSQPNV